MSARVGYGITSSSESVKADIMSRLKTYMSGFMDDPRYVSRGDEPSGRASWPSITGAPGKAWDSPLAHRKFFDWQTTVSAGRKNGRACIDVGAWSNLLHRIGADLTVAGKSTADYVVASMQSYESGAPCVTWDEWFHFFFGAGARDNSGTADKGFLGKVAEKVNAPRGFLGSMARGVLAPQAAPVNRTIYTRTTPVFSRGDENDADVGEERRSGPMGDIINGRNIVRGAAVAVGYAVGGPIVAVGVVTGACVGALTSSPRPMLARGAMRSSGTSLRTRAQAYDWGRMKGIAAARDNAPRDPERAVASADLDRAPGLTPIQRSELKQAVREGYGGGYSSGGYPAASTAGDPSTASHPASRWMRG